MKRRLLTIGAIALFLVILVLAATAKSGITTGQNPVASFTYSPSAPMPGDNITFDASTSYATSGTIISYAWDFGDGTVTTVTNPTLNYSYIMDGTYTVQLTVTDSNGAQGTTVAVIDVSTVVFFRVVIYGTLAPLSTAKVTAYYNATGTWQPIPAGPGSFEIKYDNMTQSPPHLAKTAAEKYRDPGFTATVLWKGASNIGFDIHPGHWNVYFKFEWGPWTAYWPNETSKVYTYDEGKVETHYYGHDDGPTWDSKASTYVVQVNDIPRHGVSPCETDPIIVGIFCPPPPQQYYLTVNTAPPGITTIPGQGLYNAGTNVAVTAPSYVNVSSNTRYRFNYWDVDGTSQGSGVNPITITMNANHTATAHYTTQYSILFNQTGLTSDATGTIATVNSNPETYAQLPYTLWVDSGSSVTYSYGSTVSSSVSGKQFRLSSVTGSSSPITVSGPVTVTGNYVAQYQVTFAQTGLDSSSSGTVVTVNGSAKLFTNLPYTLWVDCGGSVTYSYSSIVSSSTTGKQFKLNTVSGPSSPIIVTGSVTVTGNYMVQYTVTFTQTGLDSTASGTIVTVNGNPQIFSTLPYTMWVNSSSSVTYAYGSTIPSSVSGKQFRLSSITGPTSPITVAGPTTITGNYVAQYQITFTQTGLDSTETGTVVTVNSTAKTYGNLPYSLWADSGSSVTYSYASTVSSSVSGKQFSLLSVTGPTSPITVAAPITIIGNYKTQYYLTVASPYDSPTPLSGWFDSGTVITESVTSPVSGPSGTQYVCTGWSGTGNVPSSGTTSSVTFTISQASSITWAWKTQYYLTVTSTYDSPTPPSGWFDSGTGITESVTSPLSGGSGNRYVATGWTGTGSVPATGSTASVTFAITQVSSITWNWKTQYQITFSQSGVGSDFAGTVVTVDSVNYGVSGLPVSFWWDSSSGHSFSFNSPLTVNASKQYSWSSTSGLSSLQGGTLTVTASGSVVGNYIIQNQVTFDQVGVGSDFTGTVAIIDSVSYSKAQLPVSFSWNVGSSHSFAFQSPLIVGANSKQYIWTSTTGLSSSQSTSITITSYGTIIGNYKTQFYLNDISIIGSPSPSSGWFDSGTAITGSVTSPTAGGSDIQYVCTGWTGTGSVPASGSTSSTTFTISAPSSITWNWKTQYYLTVTSSHDSPSPLSGWFDSGTSITESVTSPVAGPSGTQYVCTGWSGTGNVPSSGLASSVTFTITQASSITWNWKTQYYLTVTSPYDSPTPVSGWFDSGTGITESVTSPTAGPSGTQYVCTGWAGSGSVAVSGSASSTTFTISQASSIAWNWKIQYTVTFGHSGLDSSASGTVVTVNGTAVTYAQLPYAIWVDSGGSVTYSYSNVSSSNLGEQFILIGVTGLSSPVTVTSPTTLTGNYKTQYQVTFSQTGVGSDFAGTVITVDSNTYTVSSLPVSFWWDNSSSHTFSFSSPLVVNASEQYNWVSSSGLSTLQSGSPIIASSGTVTGNYSIETKYQITFSQNGLSTDFAGTVMIIDGTNYGVVDLPVSFWWDPSSVHTFAYQSPLVVSPNVKQYVWTGTSGLSTVQSGSLTVTTSGGVTGNYNTQYYLTLTTNPPGVNSPSGAGWYYADTNATISTTGFVTIVPGSSRYRFNGWTTVNVTEIADPTRSPTTVIMDEAKTVAASYVPQYVVVLDQSGVGSDFTGTVVSIDAINYNVTNLPATFFWDNGTTHSFDFKSPLIVSPNAKSYIWTSTNGLSTLQSDFVVVTSAGSVTGNYGTQYYLTIGTSPPGIATIPGQGWYNNSASATLTAPAVANYSFANWIVNGIPQGAGVNPITLTMNMAQNATGQYTPITPYILTIIATSGGTTNPSPGNYTYSSGTTINVTALPNSGYVLDHWELYSTNLSSTINPISVLMSMNHTLIAVFNIAPPPLSVTITPIDSTAAAGGTVLFTSSASGGTAPYTYQWYLDGAPVSGATSASWTFPATSTGIYFVYLKVTDANSNTAYSSSAKVTVTTVPVGGYSVSLGTHTSDVQALAYSSLVCLFAAALIMVKRKRK